MMRLLLTTVFLLSSIPVFADASYAAQDRVPPQAHFLVSYQSERVAQNHNDNNEPSDSSLSEPSSADPAATNFIGSLKRYDATWLYPVSQSAIMNVDVGVNLRYLDGQLSMDSAEGRVLHNYRAAIPMIYASALFDLPFKGLSARLDGGSRINVAWENLFTSFDYKAALRYDWENGMGLEGGWQHRQWQLDNLGTTDNRIESKGLFLDLKYKF